MTSASALQGVLVPPINFAMVCPGVYRSGYPTKKNYPFLHALRLRSVLYLCPEEYADSNLIFCDENGIRVLRFPTEGNKEPFNDISEPLMHRILSAIVDVRNLPLLIHCNKGKHRTGTVVAALRLLQDWSYVSIFEEYKRFAEDKARMVDQQYIELYHPIIRLVAPYVAPWVHPTSRMTVVYSEQALHEAEARQLGYSPLDPDVVAAHARRNPAAAAAAAANPAIPVTEDALATEASATAAAVSAAASSVVVLPATPASVAISSAVACATSAQRRQVPMSHADGVDGSRCGTFASTASPTGRSARAGTVSAPCHVSLCDAASTSTAAAADEMIRTAPPSSIAALGDKESGAMVCDVRREQQADGSNLPCHAVHTLPERDTQQEHKVTHTSRNNSNNTSSSSLISSVATVNNGTANGVPPRAAQPSLHRHVAAGGVATSGSTSPLDAAATSFTSPAIRGRNGGRHGVRGQGKEGNGNRSSSSNHTKRHGTWTTTPPISAHGRGEAGSTSWRHKMNTGSGSAGASSKTSSTCAQGCGGVAVSQSVTHAPTIRARPAST